MGFVNKLGKIHQTNYWEIKTMQNVDEAKLGDFLSPRKNQACVSSILWML
jgi:hypothetical protein